MLSGAERAQSYRFWRLTAGLKRHPCTGSCQTLVVGLLSLCPPAEGREQFSPAWLSPELGAETQEQPWPAEGDPTSSSPTSGPPGPSLGGGGGRQSPLTAGCPLLRGCAVLGAGACLLLHRRPGLVGLVILGGDQLHQALVADVGYLLNV